MNIFKLLLLFLTGSNVTFTVPGITNPQQLFWRNDEELLLVKDGDIYDLDIFSQNIKYIGRIQTNVFLGIDKNNQLEYCEFEHSLIHSSKEFSTRFKVRDKELKFFETIRPIYLQDNVIIAKTAVDILEQHYYKIDIDTEEKIEIPHPPYELNDQWRTFNEDIFGNIQVEFNIRKLIDEKITDWIALMYTKWNEKS